MPLQYDSSQFYYLKQTFEELFGKKAWIDLKECTDVKKWKNYSTKTLQAISISIGASIEIYDEPWKTEIELTISRGIDYIKTSNEIDELLSYLTATLIKVSFMQIGKFPNRQLERNISLKKENWKINDHRSVQYVQTEENRDNIFKSKQIEQIGFNKQQQLIFKYKTSKTKESYSEWCKHLVSSVKCNDSQDA